MSGTVVVAGCLLVVTVVVGLVAHECAHAVVLTLARVEYTVTYAPGRSDGIVGLVTSCPWAAVHPHPTGHESATVLRVAALAPLALAVPIFGLGFSGLLPVESPLLTAIGIGWLACAIPSPQDFSVAFYAHRALEAVPTDGSDTVTPVSRAD
ncbi:hypothetical protein [Natronorubrum sulfidifaciens]|uniref:Peptidase M50 n=1 Tax=Natronorubrum sulfidifaciens JCM 14089 TaxID=1230460 RepID=L9VZB5_9EURY|nr:hypothetical protein [Natronorubrum sulfidifaciens]ELY42544.1 hypothetical protein C495_14562 [Natronorubrum sulfidifaciens JCM 14089]